MQFLQEGIEGFLKAFRKLPKQVRSMPAACHLETKLKAFRDSIPLLLDLKNEALRERFAFIYLNNANKWKTFVFIFLYHGIVIDASILYRHWQDLMERTGTRFEMTTETFTLENMFAMELHRHSDIINEIVGTAVKELSVEKVI